LAVEASLPSLPGSFTGYPIDKPYQTGGIYDTEVMNFSFLSCPDVAWA
jgi:hypothetical protein